MESHGRRLQDNSQRQNVQSRLVIPLSTQFAGSRLERVFSSIQPLVTQSADIPFRTYARRFFPHTRSSSNNVQVGRNSIARSQSNSIDISTNSDSLQGSQIGQSSNNSDTGTTTPPVPNVVINIDLDPYNGQNETRGGNNVNTDASQSTSPNENDDQLGALSVDSNNSQEYLGELQDLRISIKYIWQYLVFIFIVLVKLLFDNINSIFILVSLSFLFVMGDMVVRKKATYLSRSYKSIIATFIIIPLSIYLLFRTYQKENFFHNASLLFREYNIVTLGDLLWIVIITDLILKIVTVLLKSFVVLLPKSVLNQRTKANLFALLERISRLYRSLAAIQPWMSYFLDGYSGPKKIFGVFLAVFYMLCKGPEIILLVKELRIAISKLLFSSGYGSNPSQSQLDEAGGRCPICHDEFTSPLRLHCTHIFCESCVLTWFTKEKTCPMCRTNILSEDPAFRDGSTSYLPQIY